MADSGRPHGVGAHRRSFTRIRKSSLTPNDSIRHRFRGTKPAAPAWLAFGGGARRCIGADFAIAEMDVVLRTVLQNFRIHTDAAADEKSYFRGIANIPKLGGRIVVNGARNRRVADVSTQLIRPSNAERLEIRCNVGDAIVANLAVHIVFFFERQLDTTALTRAFAQALTNLPIFAGRMALVDGRMRIRCTGQGVPFTTVSSGRTLREAIRSASQDSGLWLIDPVNGATARWGWGPLCKVRVTHLADDATAIGFSWHHAIGDMQTLMHFMNAWAAAAADKPLAEPLIVEDRAAYLDEHLACRWRSGARGALPRARRNCA